jgi:HAD-superfamily hydrolase, subfamily IIB
MKALASDMDGTLFFHHQKNHFKEGDLRKIKEFQKAGHLFGICTGRPLYSVLKDTKSIIDCDFYITTSGAVILDKDLQVIEEHLITYETVCYIYQRYKDVATILVQVDHQLFALTQNNENIECIEINVIEKGKIEGVSLVFKTDKEAALVCQQINESDLGLIGHQNTNSIDMTSPQCSKGKAVLSIKKMKDIETMGAIGDSFNDLSMIEIADLGMTLQTSPQMIKEKAKHVVDSVEQGLDILFKI